MARLPLPGGDVGNWGDILNEYLSQSHKSDGHLKDTSVTSNTIAPNAVTASALASNSVTSAALAPGSVTSVQLADNAVRAASIADGSVSESLLSAEVVAKLNATQSITDGSIAKAKLTTSVQTSLDRADSALQSAPVISVAGKTGAINLSKLDVALENVDNTSDATKNNATATFTNKTISGTNNVLSNIPQSAITNLTTDLSTKALDTSVVHLGDNQTITGNKAFTGSLTLGGATVITASDSRLSDARAPKVIDTGIWSEGVNYVVGDIVTYVGRRWQCIVPHTAPTSWSSTNWILIGSINEEFSLLPADIPVPTEHLRRGGTSATTSVPSQNIPTGIRFGAGRTTTIQAITIETTTSTTTPTVDVQFYTLNRSTNTLSGFTVLGSFSAATFNTAGIKTLSGLSQSVTAGTDFVIGLCARGTTAPTMRASLAIDPASYSIGTAYGQVGWTGTNQLTGLSYNAVPLILITATA